MALKGKNLGFVAKSNMFVGSNYDNEGQLGIVTFGDNCEYTELARKRTDKVLQDNEAYQLLQDICKTRLGCQKHVLYNRSHQTKTEIWSILFHKFLIEIMENDGWHILEAPEPEYYTDSITDNAMVIG